MTLGCSQFSRAPRGPSFVCMHDELPQSPVSLADCNNVDDWKRRKKEDEKKKKAQARRRFETREGQ